MSVTISGMGSTGAYSSVSGASMNRPPHKKMSDLFSRIDSSGSGTITQSQFNQAFQTMNPPASFKAAGASAVWSSLDPAGSGQVSRDSFVNGMKNLMVQLRQDNNGGAAQISAAGTQALNNIGG